MGERELMIGLLREAYEALERNGQDRCECDESVNLMCYFCRLREVLHRVDPGWTCAYEEERGDLDQMWTHNPGGGFWGDERSVPRLSARPPWMPEQD